MPHGNGMTYASKRSVGGARLRAWLRDERRSQIWLGTQLGTHQTNISRWILGQTIPPIGMLIAIRRITGISVESWAESPAKTTTLAEVVE